MKNLQTIIQEKLRLGKNTKIEFNENVHHIEWANLHNWFCLYDINLHYHNSFRFEVNDNGNCYWIGVTNKNSFIDYKTFENRVSKHSIGWGEQFNYIKDQRLNDIQSYFPDAEKINLKCVDDDNFNSQPLILHISCKNEKDIIYIVGPNKEDMKTIYNLFVKDDAWTDVKDVNFYDLRKKNTK